MKILFLDIDGVLNCRSYIGRPGRNSLSELDWFQDQIDPACMDRLNQILDQSKAKVVISSSWRIILSLPELQEILTSKGFRGEIIGKTPELPPDDREEEISLWLRDNPAESFVILDDGRVDPNFDHQVLTSFEEGLLDKHVPMALKILGV